MVNYQSQLKAFAIAVLAYQVLIIIIYGVYVRNNTSIVAGHLNQYYPWFQDVNVMMLIGFGYLMTFIRTHGWSALGFTFIINAIGVESYILWQALWEKILVDDTLKTVSIDMSVFLRGSFAVAAILISFGAIIGRVSPFELFVISVIQIIGYSLNQVLLGPDKLNVLDMGGSIVIHIFGAYFGLTVSYILGRKQPVQSKSAEGDYISYIFGCLGTLFLWMYWPSFNSGEQGIVGQGDFQRTITITNTIISLIGSCLSACSLSIILRGKLNMDDVLNATLAGGVAMGASSNLILNGGVSLLIGTIAGIISTLGFFKLSSILNRFGLFDTCGVHNLHAMPGVIGGLASAIVLAGYKGANLDLNGASVSFAGIDFNHQAALQVAGTFISIGMALGFGIVTGIILSFTYKIENSDFFEDSAFWEIPEPHIQQGYQKAQ